MAKCTIIEPVMLDRFTGCDGKPWSDKFLQEHLDEAVREENYEWAAECKGEQELRRITATPEAAREYLEGEGIDFDKCIAEGMKTINEIIKKNLTNQSPNSSNNS